MENSKNTNVPQTADVKLPGDHMQNEKKCPLSTILQFHQSRRNKRGYSK